MDDPCIKKALDVLSIASLNPEKQEIYEDHLKWLRMEASAIEKAEEKAMMKGRIEEKEAIAKNLLAQNIPLTVIGSATGLSEEQIKLLF